MVKTMNSAEEYKVLSWKDIDKVQPTEVVAFLKEGGVFKLITRDKQLYISHGWQKSEIEKVCPAYIDIINSIQNARPIRPDWLILNIGLGNKIYVKSELRQNMRICNVSPSQLFRQWEGYVLDGITRLDSHCEYELVVNPLRVAPDMIESLEDNEVFVFGSNIFGFHDSGAAELAHKKFGAIYGECSGHRGQSYAIITDGVPYSKTIALIRKFISYAEKHPNLKFIVTKVGCGMAGYAPSQIAPFFDSAISAGNILLPKEFWKFLM